jgi:hypothetical protein
MFTMRPVQVALLALVLALAVACGGSASPSPSTAVAPTTAASVPGSTAPSTSPSTAASVGPSLLIPSFTLPSSDKELEALLPATLCGTTTQKTSISGAQAVGTSKDTQALLQRLGKSPNDVSLAIAFAAGCDVSAGIFRIKGTDSTQLADAFKSTATAQGETFEQRTVGGKNVLVSASASGGTSTYAYFGGDAFLFVAAKDDAAAGPVLQQMP